MQLKLSQYMTVHTWHAYRNFGLPKMIYDFCVRQRASKIFAIDNQLSMRKPTTPKRLQRFIAPVTATEYYK
ncbi:hypothetical protein MAH1_00310 [Sessilibacter sp. MAH1]